VKSFVQFLQAALTCGILVALIFSIPAVMANAPIHLVISLMSPTHFLAEQQSASGAVSSLTP